MPLPAITVSFLEKLLQVTLLFSITGAFASEGEPRSPVIQIPVSLYAPDGSVMTRNPFFFKVEEQNVRFYFIPEDDHSMMYEWMAPVNREGRVEID